MTAEDTSRSDDLSSTLDLIRMGMFHTAFDGSGPRKSSAKVCPITDEINLPAYIFKPTLKYALYRWSDSRS